MPHGLISTVLGSFLSFASRSYSIGIGSEFFLFASRSHFIGIGSFIQHSRFASRSHFIGIGSFMHHSSDLPHDLIPSLLAQSHTSFRLTVLYTVIGSKSYFISPHGLIYRYWLRFVFLLLPEKKQTSKSSIPVAREQCKTPPQFHNNRHTFNGRHASKKVLCPDIYSIRHIYNPINSISGYPFTLLAIVFWDTVGMFAQLVVLVAIVGNDALETATAD